jgi:hypothetical protein
MSSQQSDSKPFPITTLLAPTGGLNIVIPGEKVVPSRIWTRIETKARIRCFYHVSPSGEVTVAFRAPRPPGEAKVLDLAQTHAMLGSLDGGLKRTLVVFLPGDVKLPAKLTTGRFTRISGADILTLTPAHG